MDASYGRDRTQMSIEMRLEAIMQSWGMPIEPGCLQHLSQLINEAGQRLKESGLISDSSKLLETENNFQKILDEMTNQAGILGLNELHEITFVNALSRLCPIFPFC